MASTSGGGARLAKSQGEWMAPTHSHQPRASDPAVAHKHYHHKQQQQQQQRSQGEGSGVFNSGRHPWVCLLYGLVIGPFAALEAIVAFAINLVKGLILALSLIIPFFEWWSRAELAFDHFREALLLLAMVLSLVVPCLPSVLVADLDESRAWRLRRLPTLCGRVAPHRSQALTCFFPSARRLDADYESGEGDSCLPSGADCLESCCACSCRDCLELCCSRVALEETPFVSPLATPAGTPGVSPQTQRRLVALQFAAQAVAQQDSGGIDPHAALAVESSAAASMNAGSTGASNAYNSSTIGGGNSSASSPSTSTSRLPPIAGSPSTGSPRLDRRIGSLRRRYKSLVFKPNAAHTQLEEQLNHVLSFDVSGDYLVTTTGNGMLYIWNFYTHECLMTFAAPSVKVAWSPRGDLIASTIITPNQGYVCLFDVTHSREVMRINMQHRVKPLDNLAWSKDGLYLAVTGDTKVQGVQQQMIAIYDSKVGGLIRDLSTGDSNNAPVLAWSPHMHRLLAFTASEFSIRVFDALSGVIVRVLTGVKSAIRSISWNPHPNRSWHIAAGTSGGTICVLDITSGQILREISGLRVNVWCVTWSPLSADYLASLDGSIRVFDTSTGDQQYEIPCASVSTSMCIEWLPGNRNVLLSAEANGVRTFELRGLNDLTGPTSNSSSSLRNQINPLPVTRENSTGSPTPPSPSSSMNQHQFVLHHHPQQLHHPQPLRGTPQQVRRFTMNMDELPTSPMRLPLDDGAASERPLTFVPGSAQTSGYATIPNSSSASTVVNSFSVGGSPLGHMMVRVASRGSSSNSSHLPDEFASSSLGGAGAGVQRLKPSRASSSVSRSSGDSKTSITRYLKVGEPESEEDEANFAFDPDEQIIVTTASSEIPLADDEVVVSFV